MQKMLFITELDCLQIMREPGALTDAITDVERVIAAAARGKINAHPRVHVSAPGAPATEMSGQCLRVLPAIGDDLGAALRVYTMNKEGDPYRPAPCELILLFDPEDLTLRSIIEDYSLHSLRTAAPSAVATRKLAIAGADRMGVIGTGRQAASQVTAIASVQSLREIRVFGRDPERRQAFVVEIKRLIGCDVIACETPEDAVRGMPIVTLAANTRTPVLFGEWLEPGMHINSISACELDENAVLRCKIFPSSTETLLYHQPRYTPFPDMVEGGRLSKSAVNIELGDVVSGKHPGREDAAEVTLFVSTGSAIWDLGVGRWIDRRARELGIGHSLLAGQMGRTGSGFVTPPPSLQSGR
jgi:ornithine cyclodeaminase/alanine dehydrogenase-like protein (mu-crystallin family)